MLTREDAYTIAKKFGSRIDNSKRHERVRVYCGAHFVGSYGISRGTRESRCNYIAKQIKLTLKQTEDFARCTLSKEQVCCILRENGKIPVQTG